MHRTHLKIKLNFKNSALREAEMEEKEMGKTKQKPKINPTRYTFRGTNFL